MKKSLFGDYGAQRFLANVSDGKPINAYTVVGTTPIVAYLNLDHFDAFSLGLSTVGAALVGAWKVEVSNDAQIAQTSNLNVETDAGHWTDITALFSSTVGARYYPAIAAVTTTSSQHVEGGPCAHGLMKITFTPASGAGTVTLAVRAKGW